MKDLAASDRMFLAAIVRPKQTATACRNALDHIDALAAENERLRAGLIRADANALTHATNGWERRVRAFLASAQPAAPNTPRPDLNNHTPREMCLDTQPAAPARTEAEAEQAVLDACAAAEIEPACNLSCCVRFKNATPVVKAELARREAGK